MQVRTIVSYAFSVIIGLVCAEAALRLVGARFATSFYVVDPDLGWALRPGAEGNYTEESVVPIRISSQGMRDDIEHGVGKRNGTLRVAVLGDSFAESMQVPLEKSFPKLMEKDLSQCSANAEVLNFGVQGYGTAQELLTWRLRAAAFQPDVVILLFYTGNDLYNNHRKLNPTNADAAPYFVMEGGKLVLQPALAKPGVLREVWATAARYSRLAQFLTDAFYKSTRTSTPKNTAEFGADYIDKLIYSAPKHEAMREAWTITEAALPLVRDEVEKTKTRFILALASSGMQVHPDRSVRDDFLKFAGGSDLFYTEKRLGEMAQRSGIQIFDIGQEMLRAADGTRTFFHGFPGNIGKGHWNADGHKFASQLLAKTVCRANP